MRPPLQPRLAPPRNYQGLILATPFMSVKELRKILGKDAETLDEHNLSPLYSVIPPKNDSNEPSLSPLVRLKLPTLNNGLQLKLCNGFMIMLDSSLCRMHLYMIVCLKIIYSKYRITRIFLNFPVSDKKERSIWYNLRYGTEAKNNFLLMAKRRRSN